MFKSAHLFVIALGLLSGVSSAAEFETADKFTASGYAFLKSSAEVRGLLGVSTGVPYAALDVVSTGTAANVYAQIWRDSTGIVVSSLTATGAMSMLNNLAVGGNIFSAGGSALAVTGGNVGIGTASPQAKLDVEAYTAGAYTAVISTSATAGSYSVAVTSTGVTNINNLVIENRTSDPVAPVTGQIWLRTN